MLPGVPALSCLSFLSGRPFERPCVRAAISGARLPFMRGGPDRFSPSASTHTQLHHTHENTGSGASAQ